MRHAAEWFGWDKPAVLALLRRTERPLMASTMASGPLDERLALHIELAGFAASDALTTRWHRTSLDDALLVRTLATLPLVRQ